MRAPISFASTIIAGILASAVAGLALDHAITVVIAQVSDKPQEPIGMSSAETLAEPLVNRRLAGIDESGLAGL